MTLKFTNLGGSESIYQVEMIELSLQSPSEAFRFKKPGIYIFRMLFDPSFIRSHCSPLWCPPGGSFFFINFGWCLLIKSPPAVLFKNLTALLATNRIGRLYPLHRATPPKKGLLFCWLVIRKIPGSDREFLKNTESWSYVLCHIPDD